MTAAKVDAREFCLFLSLQKQAEIEQSKFRLNAKGAGCKAKLFIEWLNHNKNVFFAYKAALGFVWA